MEVMSEQNEIISASSFFFFFFFFFFFLCVCVWGGGMTYVPTIPTSLAIIDTTFNVCMSVVLYVLRAKVIGMYVCL